MVCWRVLRGCNARHFLILLIPLLIAALLSPVQVVQAVGDAWPMYGHDTAHTARSASNGPNTADLKWTYAADGVVSDPVIAADGTIFFTVWINFYNTQVIALNPDGSLKWQQSNASAEYRYPVIGTNGNLYLISMISSGDDFLLALNPADGNQLWSFNIGDSDVIGTNYSHPIVGPDGTIFAASALGKSGYGTIFAVNPNGTQKWSWNTNLISCGTPNLIYCSIESTPALAPNGNLLFKSYEMGVIALNSSTGSLLWNVNPSMGDPFDQTLSIGTNNVAYTTEGYGRFNFFAFNSNGSVKWTKALANWNDYAMSALSADGSLLYRGDNGGVFYSIFTANGMIRWRFEVPIAGVHFSGAPVLSANGIIYFTVDSSTGTPDGSHGYVYALRADSGEMVWQYEVGFSGANLAMGPDGTLYVPGDRPDQLGTGNIRMLYAFECADGACALPAHNPVQTVTNLNNSGAGSLRQAVVNAMWGDSIVFSPDLTGTIVLDSSITIMRDLTITGPGAALLAVSGNDLTRLFSIEPGISVNMSNLTFSHANFSSAFGYGGAIENSGNLIVSDMVFLDNFSANGGAAIYNGGTLTVNTTTFSANSSGSSGSGGAIYNAFAAIAEIRRSTFAGNDANSGGGAIYNYGTLTISNSTFSGNFTVSSVSRGGAINNPGTLTLINSTLSGNTVGIYGYGGAIENSGSGSVALKNSIIANNLAFGGQCSGNAITNGGSNLQYPDSDCGVTIPSLDPLLVALASNGGPTQTLSLLEGSPAIDAGNNAICAASPVSNVDQRNLSRPIDGDGNGTAQCDIGAVEWYPPTDIVVEAPGAVNIADGSTYSLGTTQLGIPITRIITVRNTGSPNLTISTNPPATTGGFTTGNLGSVSLAPGASTTFSLTCSATTAGNPVSGSVSFANDDSDENPFNFTVTCVVTETPANAAPPLNYGTSSTVTLSWNMVSGALEYQLQVDDSLTFTPLLTYTVIVPGNTLSIVTPALPDGLYYWRVQAKQPNGTWGGWSEIQSFVIATS